MSCSFPHIAGTTVERVRRHSAIAERNLAGLKAARVPADLFNRNLLTSASLRWKLSARHEQCTSPGKEE
jgi:hypothetical protein